MPEVQQERTFALLCVEELQRFVSEAVRDVLAFGAIFQRACFEFVWREVARRTRVRLAVNGDIEALLIGPVLRVQAEVPLADMRGMVAALPQGLRDCILVRLEKTQTVPERSTCAREELTLRIATCPLAQVSCGRRQS